MNKVLMFCLSIISVLSGPARADSTAIETQVIFGDDNRQEIFNVSPFWQEISQSIAGKVSVDHISKNGGTYQLNGTALNRKVCPTNRFAEQVTVPSCSGFLVKQNLLVTAGHCVKTQEDCDRFVWVFNYQLKNAGDPTYTHVSENQVYRCRSIVSRRLEDFGAVDYAILELDRPVENRRPLALGLDHPVTPGMQVTSLGHPLGLPMKFIDSASIIQLRDGNRTLDTDLDAFQGNSGSPVFDAATGIVIGVTSHGHADHVRDPKDNCKVVRVCMPGDKCNWSATSSISNLKSESVLQ